MLKKYNKLLEKLNKYNPGREYANNDIEECFVINNDPYFITVSIEDEEFEIIIDALNEDDNFEVIEKKNYKSVNGAYNFVVKFIEG